MRRQGRCEWGGQRIAVPIALLCALYVLAVGTSAGRDADNEVFINPAPAADWLWAAAIASVIPWALTLGAIVATLMAARNHGSRGAIAVVVVLAGANLTALVLEHALAGLDPLGGESRRVLGEGFFPSGHALAAMSLACVVVLAVPARYVRLAAVLASAYAAIVGVALVAAANHHLSDVLAAMLIVAAWAGLGNAIDPRSPARPSFAALLLGAAGAVLGGGLVAAVSGVAPHEHPELVVGCALVIWTAFAIAGTEGALGVSRPGSDAAAR